MEALHSDTSRGAKVDRPTSARLGNRHNLQHGIRADGQPLRAPGRVHGRTLRQIGFPNSGSLTLHFRHPKRPLLGPGLRPTHHSRDKEIHRSQKRPHSTPEDGDRALHIDLRDDIRRSVGDREAEDR